MPQEGIRFLPKKQVNDVRFPCTETVHETAHGPLPETGRQQRPSDRTTGRGVLAAVRGHVPMPRSRAEGTRPRFFSVQWGGRAGQGGVGWEKGSFLALVSCWDRRSWGFVHRLC